MEPVTHLLTGACLSRTGLNRRAAYATLTMVVAAEFPDIDTLWSLRGPIEGFQHHRGITHTFLGLPFEAALIVAGVYAWHRWRVKRAKAAAGARPKPLTAAPVRWGVLYGLALVALLSHLLLDYTNNYGLRPFFPFNGRWYAASFVFIWDPVMFVLLLGALILPWLFGLVNAEVGAKKQTFRGRGWAITALAGILAWWGVRAEEHQRAVQMAMTQTIVAPTPASTTDTTQPQDTAQPQDADTAYVPTFLQARAALASPNLLSPFRWSAVMDFGPVYRLAEIDTEGGTVATGETTYPKPGESAAVLAAERSKLGRAYMDWSPMPFVEVTKADSELAVGGGEPSTATTLVTFRDPRFLGGGLRESGRQWFTGTVELDAAGRVVGQAMDGRVEP
jgi:inner membrane protein